MGLFGGPGWISFTISFHYPEIISFHYPKSWPRGPQYSGLPIWAYPAELDTPRCGLRCRRPLKNKKMKIELIRPVLSLSGHPPELIRPRSELICLQPWAHPALNWAYPVPDWAHRATELIPPNLWLSYIYIYIFFFFVYVFLIDVPAELMQPMSLKPMKHKQQHSYDSQGFCRYICPYHDAYLAVYESTHVSTACAHTYSHAGVYGHLALRTCTLTKSIHPSIQPIQPMHP